MSERGVPLKLSAAIITADAGETDGLSALELSISARVLSGFDIMLATTRKPDDGAPGTGATRHLELHINSILLSSLPRLIHLSGRSPGAHHDDAAARSYTLTMTFSDGSPTARSWSTTFEVPRSSATDSRWHLTVPFSPSSHPAATWLTGPERPS